MNKSDNVGKAMNANANINSYREKMRLRMRKVLQELECQPIFFIGTGFSIRYFHGLSWMNLLDRVSKKIDLKQTDFDYIRQKHNNNHIKIGTYLQNEAFEWAWRSGRNLFPSEYFSGVADKSIFLKHIVGEVINENVSEFSGDYLANDELKLLIKSKPHAIITTNYDNWLEKIFSDYEVVVGEKIIRRDMNIVGEIFKIHGSMDMAPSIVISEDDYENYRKKKKYISAKLLTYLAEHPVFIIGYGLGDTNITGILNDVAEIIGNEGRIIDNIFYTSWNNGEHNETPREEWTISSNGNEFRVQAIETDSFDWIFEELAKNRNLEWVDPKILRALSSRFFKLIRSDIPKNRVELDYQQLSKITDSDETLPILLGISKSDSPTVTHPFNLTQVARAIGYRRWHKANDLLRFIKGKDGIDLKSTDNRYHIALTSGSSKFRWYSQESIDLLRKVKENKDYEINLD